MFTLKAFRAFVVVVYKRFYQFESFDLIGSPECFRWGDNPGVFKINHTRQIKLIDFASVAAINLNVCACKRYLVPKALELSVIICVKDLANGSRGIGSFFCVPYFFFCILLIFFFFIN